MASLATMIEGPLRTAGGRGTRTEGASETHARGIAPAVAETPALAPREQAETPRDGTEDVASEAAEARPVTPAERSTSEEHRLAPRAEAVAARDDDTRLAAQRGPARLPAPAPNEASRPSPPQRVEPRGKVAEPPMWPAAAAATKGAERTAGDRPLAPVTPVASPKDATDRRTSRAAAAPPLVVRERVIERTIERVVQTAVVATSRPEPAPAAPPSAPPAQRAGEPREATPPGGAEPPERAPVRLRSDPPMPPARPGMDRPDQPAPRPAAVPVAATPPPRTDARPATEPRVPARAAEVAPPPMKPAAAPVAAAPPTPSPAPSPILQRVVPKPPPAPIAAPQRPATSAAAAARPSAPVVRVSVGRLEVHMKPTRAPQPAEVTLPRAHEIDPGLSFGPITPGRW